MLLKHSQIYFYSAYLPFEQNNIPDNAKYSRAKKNIIEQAKGLETTMDIVVVARFSVHRSLYGGL